MLVGELHQQILQNAQNDEDDDWGDIDHANWGDELAGGFEHRFGYLKRSCTMG